MAGPQNGIVGDSYGTDLPKADVKEQYPEEKAMARFSKTTEFKRLKQHLEARIEFYRGYLPNGEPIDTKTDIKELGHNWVVANAIIKELSGILDAYEIAKEVASGDKSV